MNGKRKGPGRPRSPDTGSKIFCIARDVRMRKAAKPKAQMKSVVAEVCDRWGISRETVFDALRKTKGLSIMPLTYDVAGFNKTAEEERLASLADKPRRQRVARGKSGKL